MKHIVDFVEHRNLCDPYQSAYRKGMSTQTALIRIMDDIRLAIDKRMVTISVFFDFSKAFDCVSHSLLIDKLKGLHFSLKWISSYLSGRRQAGNSRALTKKILNI